MQGVTLLAGLALLGSLAVPTALPASEEGPAPAPGEVVPAGPAPEPAPAAPPAAPPDAPEAESDPAAPPRDDGGRDREPDARAAATRTVLMEGIEFKPRRITIDPGDTVEWENRDEARHDALGENGSFETPIIDRGETSSHTFDRKGRFPYFCSIHQGMTGTIQVGSSSRGGGGGGGEGSDSGGTSSGSGGVAGGGTSSGTSSATGGTGSFGSTGSSGTSSSLPSTGSELLWLGLIGYALVAFGAFVRLAAVGR